MHVQISERTLNSAVMLSSLELLRMIAAFTENQRRRTMWAVGVHRQTGCRGSGPDAWRRSRCDTSALAGREHFQLGQGGFASRHRICYSSHGPNRVGRQQPSPPVRPSLALRRHRKVGPPAPPAAGVGRAASGRREFRADRPTRDVARYGWYARD